MERSAAWLVVLVLLAGCRAPKPSWNLLAPYGATRVPPPSTGTFGKPDAYYQPSIQPAPTGLRSEVSTADELLLAGDPREAGVAASEDAADSARGAVHTASAQTGSASRGEDSNVRLAVDHRETDAELPIRIIETDGPASPLRAQLTGMRVNDVTRPLQVAVDGAEPQRFEPPERMQDISQLPPASPRRSLSPARTPSQLGGSKSTPPATSSGWQAKTGTRDTLRVAGG